MYPEQTPSLPVNHVEQNTAPENSAPTRSFVKLAVGAMAAYGATKMMESAHILQSSEAIHSTISASAISIAGLKRAVSREARAGRLLESAEGIDHEIASRQHMAEAVHHVTEPREELLPTKRSSERAVMKNARRQAKLVRATTKHIDLRSRYGSHDLNGQRRKIRDASGNPLQAAHIDEDNNIVPKFQTAVDKTFARKPMYAVEANDLGTDAQEARLQQPWFNKRRAKSERKAAKELRKTNEGAAKASEELSQTVNGTDKKTRQLAERADKKRTKATKLTT